VKPGRGVFKEGEFTEKGQWMDGWESRRSFGRQFRPSGLDHDWCTLRLGFAGRIHGVDVDTHHFRGNAPLRVAVDARSLRLDPDPTTVWTRSFPRPTCCPTSRTRSPALSEQRWTHLRLRIYPDGGVARFRAYGEVIPTRSTTSRASSWISPRRRSAVAAWRPRTSSSAPRTTWSCPAAASTWATAGRRAGAATTQ
jgi:allantoicase